MNHRLVKTYRKRRVIVILIILFGVFFFLLQKGLLTKLNPVFSSLVTPLWKTEDFTSDFLSMTVKSKSDLYKQNVILKYKIEALQNNISKT